MTTTDLFDVANAVTRAGTEIGDGIFWGLFWLACATFWGRLLGGGQ